MSTGTFAATGAKHPTTQPTSASTAAKPAAASSTATAAAAPAAAASTTSTAVADLKPGDPKAGQGKAAACGACHGMDGNSTDPQYPKLAGQNAQYIVHQLENFKSGKRQNPIMLGMATPLSAQDMRDIAAYFASQHVSPGVADTALVAEGEKVYREGDTKRGVPACMACHSMDGSGNPGAMYPQLAGQHAQYVEAQLKAWHDGTTWGSDAHSQIMPMIAKKLDAQEIAAVASYVEGLHATGSIAAPASAGAH
ncbi:c-type cytochrome [Dyella sp. A6]|uniref:c-type cytochrome n=1 Tax=Dyella aluminiiresistens TaxID=3069105 RepID=UPI002E788CFC|nr:c-type cytochrome [Dyella sp. A6]